MTYLRRRQRSKLRNAAAAFSEGFARWAETSARHYCAGNYHAGRFFFLLGLPLPALSTDARGGAR
jgi:hypothetical protein